LEVVACVEVCVTVCDAVCVVLTLVVEHDARNIATTIMQISPNTINLFIFTLRYIFSLMYSY
jgi:hypothetical protein